MNIDIPLDGTNVNEVTAEKDGLSLLILRQAFLDAVKDTTENDTANKIESETNMQTTNQNSTSQPNKNQVGLSKDSYIYNLPLLFPDP